MGINSLKFDVDQKECIIHLIPFAGIATGIIVLLIKTLNLRELDAARKNYNRCSGNPKYLTALL